MAVGGVAIGLVIGFVLGGVAPRVALEAREEEIAELREQLEDADSGGWRSPVPGFDRILRGPEQGPRPLPMGDERERSAEAMDRERELGVTDAGVAEEGRWRDRWEEDRPEDRLAAFQRAAAIQRVRRVQSRAALFEQADLSDDERAEVDTALAEMNDALVGHGEELLLLAMSDEAPPARDLLGITHDVTGILHRAQLRLEDVLGPDRAGAVEPSALEIWNHVDLAQLEPAARALAERR